MLFADFLKLQLELDRPVIHQYMGFYSFAESGQKFLLQV